MKPHSPEKKRAPKWLKFKAFGPGGTRPQCLIILNSNAHIFWPKGAQKCAHQKFSKSAQMCTYFGQKAHKNAHTRHKNGFFKSTPNNKFCHL